MFDGMAYSYEQKQRMEKMRHETNIWREKRSFVSI